MHSVWCWCATSLLLVSPLAAEAVREKHVDLLIGASGSVRETVRLRVVTETADDVETWSTYAIYLDENRRLISLEAWLVEPGGKRHRVGRKQRTRVEASDAGSLHDSSVFEVLDVTDLRLGWGLEVDHTVMVSPYFPAGALSLLSDGPVAAMEIRLRAEVPGLRWRLEGDARALAVETQSDGGVVVSGTLAEPEEIPALAPTGAGDGPVLRYAWGRSETWPDVAAWYRKLLDALPPVAPAVVAEAKALTAQLSVPRDRFEVLLAHVRRKVRYVAVEVGIGGFRPSPSAATLSRRWGDCKDKSLLLIELLEAVGIEAYPALIKLDAGGRIPTQLPSPFVFNHLIVAVPATGVGATSEDPVADDLVFVDPTQDRGGVSWLHRGVQDQDALVVTATGGRLVRTPTLPQASARVLTVDLEVLTDGRGQGHLVLDARGRLAAAVAARDELTSTGEIEADLRGVVSAWFPGATIGALEWHAVDTDLPHLRLHADLELGTIFEGTGTRRALRLPSVSLWPAPRDLATDRTLPAVLRPARLETTWRVTLPDATCVPDLEPVVLENEAGHFRQTIDRDDDGRLVISRRALIATRWIEPTGIENARALALAEHRTLRRRLRLRCGDAEAHR